MVVPVRDETSARTAPEAELVCELLRAFYVLGWTTSSGGGISIASADGSCVYVAPSGVQKERVVPEDIFTFDPACEAVVQAPHAPGLRASECAPLFAQAYRYAEQRPRAVIHSHALEAVVCTRLFDREFRAPRGLEMAKGVPGHANTDVVTIPIIENTEREAELASALRGAILAYPGSCAVLVRNHGCYVWGKTWQVAKTTAEALHFLFAAAERFHMARVLPVDPSSFWNSSKAALHPPRAWIMADGVDTNPDCDLRYAHREKLNPVLISGDVLASLGVNYMRFSCDEQCPRLLEWRAAKGYNYSDVVTVSRESLGDKFDETLKRFASEHFHSAPEVRGVLAGSGYFDIRSTDGRWIRIQVLSGDVLELPAGSYHRFICDRSDYIKALRLFKGNPVWTPIPVCAADDDHEVRKEYCSRYLQKSD
jgi:methylthioribulose-1-phosphate dehydratase